MEEDDLSTLAGTSQQVQKLRRSHATTTDGAAQFRRSLSVVSRLDVSSPSPISTEATPASMIQRRRQPGKSLVNKREDGERLTRITPSPRTNSISTVRLAIYRKTKRVYQ